MAEEKLNESLIDLREVELKVGRKTPESLLLWMRDAADCGDGCTSDAVDRSHRCSDSFSGKINNLKEEMRCLRCADVRILHQLVAVHEGIEAMRWMMEERGALASHGSSLTGSLSSLVTVEEHGPSSSPCRGSLSPTQDFTETSDKESADHPPHAEDGNSNDKSQPQDTDVVPLQDIKNGANTIRRALLRSNRARRAVKADSFVFTKQSGETQTEHQTPESSKGSWKNIEEDECVPNKETALPGYDAQWCWIESQDDVTFL